MIKTCALPYYVHMTTYNQINQRRPRVTIIQFYILIWFHIQIHFHASLSVWVSSSGHTVKCTIKYITKNPFNKLHHCIPACSTWNHTLLHTPTILHMKKYFYQPVTCARKYCTRQRCHILQFYTHARFTPQK